MHTTTLSLLLLLAALPGCVTVDGLVVDSAGMKGADQAVRRRAAFELSCPAESLTLTLLGVGGAFGSWPSQIGVTGCDRKVVYVNADGLQKWVANSHTDQE